MLLGAGTPGEQIADYLLHFSNGGNHKVRTIEGYRAMIASSPKSRGLTVGTDPYLSGLIASFYMDRPAEPNLVPHWDLSAVLNALIRSPFESKYPASVPLKFLICKAVFYSHWRQGPGGEKYLLDLSWSPNYREVTLRPYV